MVCRPMRSRSLSASSSRRSDGCCAMTRAMCTRLRSPPDSCVMGRSASARRSWLVSASVMMAQSLAACGVLRHGVRPHETMSRTVNGKLTVVSWERIAR